MDSKVGIYNNNNEENFSSKVGFRFIKPASVSTERYFQTLKIAPQYFKSTFDDIKNQETLRTSAGLEVICAGLPRTGTLSLKAALTTLLGGRCYHGFDTLFGSQNDVDFWSSVARNQASDEEIRQFFCSRGCTAAADFPAALFYKRLMQVFPNAKVILTTRSPVSWQKSMKESLYLVRICLLIWL